jgi:hypothetical protein
MYHLALECPTRGPLHYLFHHPSIYGHRTRGYLSMHSWKPPKREPASGTVSHLCNHPGPRA